MGISAKQPVVWRAARAGIEVNYLGSGVNSAIGAPGAGHRDRRVGDPGQRGFDFLLHAGAVRLALPATKAAAVIFDHRSHAVQSQRQFAHPSGTRQLPRYSQAVGALTRYPSLASNCCADSFCASSPH